MYSFQYAFPLEEDDSHSFRLENSFYDFPTHQNLGIPSEDETNLGKNGPLNGENSHNSNIDSQQIIYLETKTIRVEDIITFESPNKAQIEGNAQIPNVTSAS